MVKKYKIGDKPKFNTEVAVWYAGRKRGLFGKRYYRLVEGFELEIRTRKLNERLGLKENEAVFFTVKPRKDMPSDGGSIPVFLYWLFAPDVEWAWIAYWVHDELWGLGYIDAWVINMDTGKLTKYLGTVTISKREGNIIMKEKMNSFDAPIVSKEAVFNTLEVVRKLKKEE